MIVLREGAQRTYSRPANARNTPCSERFYSTPGPASGVQRGAPRAHKMTRVQSDVGFPAAHSHTGMGPLQRSVSVTNMEPERKFHLPPDCWEPRAWRPMTPSFAAVFERAGTNAREQTRYRGHLSGIGNPFYKSQLPPPGPTQAWPGMALPQGRAKTGLTPPATPIGCRRPLPFTPLSGPAGFPTGSSRVAPREHCMITMADDRPREPGFLAGPAPSMVHDRRRDAWQPRATFLNGYAPAAL